MAPELVGDFTQQVDAHGARLCSIVQTVGDTLIAIGVSLAAQVAAMALGPLAAEGEEMAQFARIGIQVGTSIVMSVAQPAMNQAAQGTASKKPKLPSGVPGLLKILADKLKPLQWSSRGVKFSWNWWQPFQNLPFFYYSQALSIVHGARAEYGALDVEGGAGDGGWGKLCSSFEGDFTNHNSLNMEKLQTWIPGQFEFIRNRIRRFYSDIYDGHIPFHGGPSMMAFLLAGNKWTGNDSFLSDLRDPGKWQ